MPHVVIKCFKGRTEETKKKCADKVAEDVAQILGCNLSSVSVDIKEYDKEDWKPEVWDKEIKPRMEKLVKKPEYTCD
ncbi:MAG: tautomerase family protein [Clostridiales bacterium]|nr:tautomerase family protein [Clostridiales bacterium]